MKIENTAARPFSSTPSSLQKDIKSKKTPLLSISEWKRKLDALVGALISIAALLLILSPVFQAQSRFLPHTWVVLWPRPYIGVIWEHITVCSGSGSSGSSDIWLFVLRKFPIRTALKNTHSQVNKIKLQCLVVFYFFLIKHF